MLMVNFLMALPFYAHPQISLILDGTGLQPFLFIMVFAVAISFVTTGFRDKPWLLVLGVLAGAATVFFIVLWLLKQANLSNAWDVLFTGSGYFTKTKIFGTVAEANAPNRRTIVCTIWTDYICSISDYGCFVCLGCSSRKKANKVNFQCLDSCCIIHGLDCSSIYVQCYPCNCGFGCLGNRLSVEMG